MNTVFFTGRLAKAPTLQTRQSSRNSAEQIKFCHIRLMRNEYAGTDDDGNRREDKVVTCDMAVFGNQAENIVKHFRKGDQMIAQGHLSTRVTQVQGENRYEMSIVLDSYEFGAPGQEKRDELARRTQDEPTS